MSKKAEYDKVKMDQFKASSALEGMTPQQALDELARIDQMISMPSEEGITPNSWVIIEINHEGEQIQKILSGWSGSYLYGDSWRLSSPIKTIDIKLDEDFYTVVTNSGSVYNLHKDNQGLRMSNLGIYNELKEQHGDKVEIIEL